MRTKSNKFFPLLEFLLFSIGLVALLLIVRSTSGGTLLGQTIEQTVAPKPTSTPDSNQLYPPPPEYSNKPTLAISLTPTPTWNPYWTPPPTDAPHIYSTVIDLSPELHENEEYFVFVRLETGEEIIYTIGPVISGFREELPQSVVDKIPLGPNDTLLGGVPFFPGRGTLSELMGDTPTPAHTYTPTLNPYPFGWTPTPTATLSPTTNPYP